MSGDSGSSPRSSPFRLPPSRAGAASSGGGLTPPSAATPDGTRASPFSLPAKPPLTPAPKPAPPPGAKDIPASKGTPEEPRGTPSEPRGTPGEPSVLRSVDPLLERLLRDMAQRFPERAAKRTRREFQALIERGVQRANSYGFLDEKHIEDFLQCVLLLDNELAGPSKDESADVWYTLTVPNKPPEQRIKRALNIAQRLAGQRQPVHPQVFPVPEHSILDAPPLPEVSVSPPPAPAEANAQPAKAKPEHAKPAAVTEKVAAPAPPAQPAPRRPERRPPRREPALTTPPEAQVTRATPPPDLGRLVRRAADGEAPQIEGFRIIEKIASGGMGTVWRAHDLRLDIEVAIKVLRSMHPAAQQQFLLEARAAAKLQHPNIIPVLRYEQYGQGGYCVMQLVRGKDAHKLIKGFGQHLAHTLDGDRILGIAGLEAGNLAPDLRAALRDPQPYYRFVACWLAGVADGLERAHNEGIVHYDVKPSNMILSFDGRLLLGDFGLATLSHQQPSDSAACVGTPGYLAPEMLAAWAGRTGTASTDNRVDIWGLGLTLHEFLTYKPAYDGTMAQALRAIALGNPPPPRDVVWQVPPELDRICRKAIQRNPDERYQHAGEMADELRNWLDGRDQADQGSKGPLSWLRRPK